MPNWIDHLVVAGFAVLLPLHGLYVWPRFLRKLRAEVPNARVSEYRETIGVQWGLTVLALWCWLAADRPLAALGLGWPRAFWFFVVVAFAIAVVGLFVLQMRDVARPGRDWSRLAKQFEPMVPLLPHSSRERNWFIATAMTAGFCEEVLFRGFFLWWLQSFVGVIAAVVIASVVFGLAHAYQGKAGMVKTGAVGLAMMLLYLLGGSLWPLVLLHVAIDIQGGWIGYLYIRSTAAQSPPVPPQSSPLAGR